MVKLAASDIRKLFSSLNEQLEKRDITGELYIVGGAVMCLVYNARPSTMDIDGYFRPSKLIREIAGEIGLENGIDEKWLNDGVKGFFSEQGTFDAFLDLSNLKIFCASPEYLLAMKCLAMRIGEEFHDIADVRYLLRFLNIDSYDDALKIITRYYPVDRFPQKTLYALDEIISGE